MSPARCFICPTIRQSRQSRQPVKSTRCAGGLINKLRKGPQVSWALFSKNSCRKLSVLPGNLCCGSTRLFRNQRCFFDFGFVNQGAKGSRAKPELMQVDYSVSLDCSRIWALSFW